MAKYINSVSIKETKFGLKVSAPINELIAELQEIASNGWVNLEIKKRKEPSKKGATHYMQVDEWKPEPKQKSSDLISDDEPLPFP